MECSFPYALLRRLVDAVVIVVVVVVAAVVVVDTIIIANVLRHGNSFIETSQEKSRRDKIRPR